MKITKYQKYLDAKSALPKKQLAWPLFGEGLENLGVGGKPIETILPKYSKDELLMRIDALGLCYTDVKEIDNGSKHPRLVGRNLKENPIVPGHEVSFTIVAVGENLKKEYKIGNRYTLQPDIWVDGKSVPFSFGMDGGYRQYAKIGREILKGDAGNYLIPLPDDMSCAASSVTEPWACVEAAYRMQYRSAFKKDGSVLFVGGKKSRKGYQIKKIWFSDHLPNEIFVSEIPEDLKQSISFFCQENEISFKKANLESLSASSKKFDDIILLDCDSKTLNYVSELLNNNGIIAIMGNRHIDQKVNIDLGRLHYDMTYYVGSNSLDIDAAYQKTSPRVTLKPNGKTWIIGAGGPMGRLHLQRAIESEDGPQLILASEISEARCESLKEFFIPFAKKYKKELIIINSVNDKERYFKIISEIKNNGGFDDILLMVAVPAVVEESVKYLGNNSVINLFAGLNKGVTANIDTWLINGPKQMRLVGHSGSGLDDQKAVIDRVISRQLKPELAIAAIGGINQIADGIKAMKNLVFPGKIVIYLHVIDFPLTAIDKLEGKIPEIGEFLVDGKTWTLEAEKFFLNRELLIHD